MKRLLIMGAPGAGKGTQAVKIAEHFGIPAISTGAIFRDNLRRHTPLGEQAAEYMAKGEYVPDELTDKLVADRLQQEDARKGFLLDGYPRTMNQVLALDDMLRVDELVLDAVIVLTVDEDAVVERLLQRAQIEGRADDTEPVIRHRLEVYREQTQPLLDVYEARGLVCWVDGMGEISEVTERVAQALEDRFAN